MAAEHEEHEEHEDHWDGDPVDREPLDLVGNRVNTDNVCDPKGFEIHNESLGFQLLQMRDKLRLCGLGLVPQRPNDRLVSFGQQSLAGVHLLGKRERINAVIQINERGHHFIGIGLLEFGGQITVDLARPERPCRRQNHQQHDE
ncbi:MAG: hypothetical protein IIA33_07625 [Planctomycetes bacterium]|nr:hypothetical protein [Planctomycetota bacterium]